MDVNTQKDSSPYNKSFFLCVYKFICTQKKKINNQDIKITENRMFVLALGMTFYLNCMS